MPKTSSAEFDHRGDHDDRRPDFRALSGADADHRRGLRRRHRIAFPSLMLHLRGCHPRRRHFERFEQKCRSDRAADQGPVPQRPPGEGRRQVQFGDDVGDHRTHGSPLSPYAGQPGLLVARQPEGPVIMGQLGKARRLQIGAPGPEVVEDSVATACQPSSLCPARIGAEQHPPRFQTGPQFLQDARQQGPRHMEKRRIGEDAVEASPPEDPV